MPPRTDYSNSDMLRMQRDAEMRVQQMRSRARTVAMMDDEPAQNRNWSTATGRSRQLPSQPLRPGGRPFSRGAPYARGGAPAAVEPEASPEGVPEVPVQEAPMPQQQESGRSGYTQRNRGGQAAASVPPPQQTDGTIIGDVMGALGMEEDTLLIIGLLLILVNQKADTTLLLALAYLLI